MRFYVNSDYKLTCATDRNDLFGYRPGNILLINSSDFTLSLEEEIKEAVNEVLKRYEHLIPKDLAKELFEENKRQIRESFDISSKLTEALNHENTSN